MITTHPLPDRCQTTEELLAFGLLIDPEGYSRVRAIVDPDALIDPACRLVFDTAAQIEAAGGDTGDPAEYHYRIGQSREFGHYGLVHWLAQLNSKYPHLRTKMPAHAERLAAIHQRRLERAAAERIADAARSGLDLRSAVEAELRSLSRSAEPVAGCPSVMDTIEALDRSATAPEQERQPTGTGLPAVDRLLGGGARPGQVVVVAACTGIGKSAFALQWCDALAQEGRRSMYVSMEMPARDLHLRILASRTGIEANDLANPLRWSEERRRQLIEASHDIDRIAIVDQPFRLPELAEKIRESEAELIVVDYLQLMPVDRKLENRQVQVSANCRAVKELALSINRPIVLIAQLSRQAEGIRPKLNHLRESGDIENTADVVLFLHRARDDTGVATSAELILAKNRNGRTGGLRMVWRGDSYRYDVAETRPTHEQMAPHYTEFDRFNAGEEF